MAKQKAAGNGRKANKPKRDEVTIRSALIAARAKIVAAIIVGLLGPVVLLIATRYFAQTPTVALESPTPTPIATTTLAGTPTHTNTPTLTPTHTTTPTPTTTPTSTPTPTTTPLPACDRAIKDTIMRANEAQARYMMDDLTADELAGPWNDGWPEALRQANLVKTCCPPDTNMVVIDIKQVVFDINSCRAVRIQSEYQVDVITDETWRYQALLRCTQGDRDWTSWLVETYSPVEYSLVWGANEWNIKQWSIRHKHIDAPWLCPFD